MTVAEVLQQLDSTTNPTDLAIGADWLAENQEPALASFYRWLVSQQLTPYRTRGSTYVWFNWGRSQVNDYYQHLTHALIPNACLWRMLRNKYNPLNSAYISFPSHSEAVAALREAFLGAIVLRPEEPLLALEELDLEMAKL